MGVKRGAVRAPVAVNFPFRRARFWLQRHEWQSHSLSFRGIEKDDRSRGTFCSFILPRDSGEGGPSGASDRMVEGARASSNSPSTKVQRRVRSPLHHASRGPPPPLSRGRKKESPVLALRFLFAPEFRQSYETGLHKEGRRSAERRVVNSRATLSDVAIRECCGRGARHGRSACTNPPLAGALAFRRSAAALVAGRTMHDSVQAALHAIKTRRCHLRPWITLKPSTWLAGRHAGGDDTRTARERLDETARGNRTRSTFRIASGMCPSMSELKLF